MEFIFTAFCHADREYHLFAEIMWSRVTCRTIVGKMKENSNPRDVNMNFVTSHFSCPDGRCMWLVVGSEDPKERLYRFAGFFEKVAFPLATPDIVSRGDPFCRFAAALLEHTDVATTKRVREMGATYVLGSLRIPPEEILGRMPERAELERWVFMYRMIS